MSSLLSRSRSLRKPAGGELRQKKDTDSVPDNNQSDARNLSPSRLPLKGPSSTSSTTRPTRAASTAASKSEGSSAPTSRSRPVSGVFGLGRSASVRQPAQSTTTSTSTTTTSRPPITTRSRPPAARPTSASGPSPTASRPTTSSGLPSSTTTAPPPRGHARTKSSATALTSSTILRPPSQTPTTAPSALPLRPPPARPLHARHQSTSSSSTSTSAAAAPSHPALRKPAFTTLQQHFSPAKNLAPKPLTSTFLAPPSPSKLPTNIALTAETARLQTELLQLHLLHRDAASVARQWESSARQKLGRRFGRVAAEEQRVREAEGRVAEAVNAAALRAWGSGKGDLEERIGLLDGVVGAVWGVGERGGRYHRVARRFERWAEGVRDVVLAREGVGEGGEVVFVCDLDAGWKEDCAGLVRKLGECRDVLGFLARGGEGDAVGEGGESSLGRMLRGTKTLVDDMLAELELMLDIEREAVRGENEWVRELNRRAGEDDTPRAGAIWRAL